MENGYGEASWPKGSGPTVCDKEELRALRAEVERLRASRDSWMQHAAARSAEWHAEFLRAERLEEALRELEFRTECLADALDC